MYSMKKSTTTSSSSSMYSINRSVSQQHVGPSSPGFGKWPPGSQNYSLKKSLSANSVVETGRGFKPSDMKDPSKREFLTNLTHRIWKVGVSVSVTNVTD